ACPAYVLIIAFILFVRGLRKLPDKIGASNSRVIPSTVTRQRTQYTAAQATYSWCPRQLPTAPHLLVPQERIQSIARRGSIARRRSAIVFSLAVADRLRLLPCTVAVDRSIPSLAVIHYGVS